MRNGTSARRSAGPAPRNVLHRPWRVTRLKPGSAGRGEIAAAAIVTRTGLISPQRPEGKRTQGPAQVLAQPGRVGFRRGVDAADKAA
jgi:hypothetical protein